MVWSLSVDNEECAPWDLICRGGDAIQDRISEAANDTLQELTNRALEAYGQAVASIGTIWVYVPTPILTAGTGSAGGGTPPQAAAFTTILGYVQWLGLAVAVLSIIGLAGLLIWRGRRGDGATGYLGRLGVVFIAVMLISGGSSIVAFLLPTTAPGGSNNATGFLQNSLWYYVGALALLSVIIGAIRMAWEQRANPGKDLLQSIVTLIVVSGAGLTVIALAAAATDAFSVWVLNGATGCDVSEAGESNCFGTNIVAMIGLSATSPIGLLGVLIFAVIAFLMTVTQVILMVIRGGLLVVLAGVLPLTASFTNTQMGRQWFQRAAGWTIAFLLYKPAAALIYAAAFRLVGSDAFASDGAGLVSIVTGLGLMLIALFALPALLRFVVPMTSAVIGGASGGLAMAGMGAAAVGAEVATGAINRTSSSTVSTSAGGPAPSAAPSGATGAGGGASFGTAGTGGGSAAAAGGGGAATGAASGGAAAGGAAAGGAAAGGAAAAGAAATGVGIPVAGAIIAAQGAAKVGGQVKSGLESAANDATGPTGS